MASISTDPDDDRRRPRRMTVVVWRSPLARPADRTEAGMLLLSVTLWLLALPIVAAASSIIWSGISDAATVQQQTRTTVTAHLLADAPVTNYSAEYGTQLTTTFPVAARWTGPDGRSQIGTVRASGGGHTGDPQPIWVDRSGVQTDPPISTGTAAVLMVGAAAAVWLGWGVLLMVMWLTVRWRLNRRRFLDWDSEWKTIEPVWSGR